MKIRFAHTPAGFGFHVLGGEGDDIMGFLIWAPATIPIEGVLSYVERLAPRYPSYQGVQSTTFRQGTFLDVHEFKVQVDDYIEAMEFANILLEELQTLGWHGGDPALED